MALLAKMRAPGAEGAAWRAELFTGEALPPLLRLAVQGMRPQKVQLNALLWCVNARAPAMESRV